MPKKGKRAPKDGPVWRRSAEEATLDRMPKYNAHACGTGPHGDAKYNRARQKRTWQKELERQEARTRGPLAYPKIARSMSCLVAANDGPYSPHTR